MPILHDDRLIGRLDASLDSNRSRLVVSALHFEAPISRTVTDTVDAELHALAGWLGAGEVVRVESVRAVMIQNPPSTAAAVVGAHHRTRTHLMLVVRR